MSTITLTGSEGYIGKHLCQIISPDVKIDLALGSDIRDVDSIDTDVCIHLAALVKVGESTQIPTEYYDTNVNGTINVLNKFTGKHFIFASTGAAANPTSPYALSKRIAEDIVIEHCTKRNIDYTIFRFYNVIGSSYGIKPTNPDGLFYTLAKAKDTNEFNIYGSDYNTPDGTAIRDYVHVMEISETIKSIIDTPTNSIENLGHGHGSSVLQIVNKYKQTNGCNFKINYLPRRDGDLESSVLTNPSKHMKTLYTIDEMVRDDR